MTTLSQDELIIALLLAGQHRIDPVVVRAADQPATEAAAALAAGEPHRAERCLGGLADVDAEVLAYAATVVDHQWTPRGAGSALVDGAAEALATAGRRLTAEARATPLGVLATAILPELLVASAMSADERRSGLGALAGLTRRRLDALERDWPSLGPAAESWTTLARADLAHRAGDVDDATDLVARARSCSGGDAAAQAQAALTRGDWFADPAGHPDTLGLSFSVAAAPAVKRAATAQAGECYDEAELLWSAIGSRSGIAAVTMRRAQLARVDGRADARDEERNRAHRLATDAGDGGLATLIAVHRLVDAVADGTHVEPDAIDPVRRWAERDGSRSYARGLVHLLAVRARRWRDDGEFTRARAAVSLARRLAGRGGYRHDGASVSIDLASVYGGAGYQRALFVAADIELGEAVGADRTLSAVEWVRLAVRATELASEAHAQADPELLGTAAGRIREVMALPVRFDADEGDMVIAVHQQLTGQLQSIPGSEAWYEAQRLRDAGDEHAAMEAFGRALDRSGRDPLLHCAVLASVPLRANAVELARALEPHLPSLPAARLFLRLDEADAAARAIEGVDPETPPAWTHPALLASLRRLQRRPAEQARHAAAAIELFEQRQQRLGRDVLRTAATDDWTVAEAYRDLVTGLLADNRPIEALAASDRARGLPAVLLADLAALPDDDRRIARAWLAANSRWAAAFEAQTGQGRPADLPGRRGSVLDAAEAELDAAEDRVRRTAPALLHKRVEAPEDLRRQIGRLPAGTVLLAYHLFRGELSGWAVTGDGAVRTYGPVPAPGLVGAVGAWQYALRRGHTDRDAARRLAGCLLHPFRTALRDHRRVVVVPHREMSAVPFGALPWGAGVLGDRHDVSVLPAVSLLDRPGAGRPVDLGQDALLVGDPDTRSGLPRLPGSRCEVLAAQRHLGRAEVLLGPQATLAGLRPRKPGRGVVHLGLHAIVRPGLPNLSHVVLAGTDRLAVADLLGADLAGDLLVLSACQTGEGTPTLAGDVSGLVRAALVAGFAHVVATLWPVQDQVAAVLMDRFYAHLAGHGDVSRALADAQRDVRVMTNDNLVEAYASLPGAEPIRTAPMRDAAFTGAHAPDPAHGSAAFAHVGGPCGPEPAPEGGKGI